MTDIEIETYIQEHTPETWKILRAAMEWRREQERFLCDLESRIFCLRQRRTGSKL